MINPNNATNLDCSCVSQLLTTDLFPLERQALIMNKVITTNQHQPSRCKRSMVFYSTTSCHYAQKKDTLTSWRQRGWDRAACLDGKWKLKLSITCLHLYFGKTADRGAGKQSPTLKQSQIQDNKRMSHPPVYPARPVFLLRSSPPPGRLSAAHQPRLESFR